MSIRSKEAEDEDIDLMCRARDGDMNAFALLFARHRQRVENFLYRLFWNREKAEDGTQEVFVKLWLARQRYEPRARFTTFLYQVARNYWRDQVRKSSTRPAEVELPAEDKPVSGVAIPLAPESTEPYHNLFLRYRQRQIQDAIARLPEIYRIVFILAYLEDRKGVEIAEILEIPEGTVKSRLHTAIRMLRGWLTSDEKEINP